jgi:hypothetical protein
MSRRLLSITFFAVMGLSGCANPARYVARESNGGVIAIPNNTNSWPSYHRKRADELMLKHFPDGYEIVREEEAVVGQVTTNNVQSNTQQKPTGNPFLQEEQTTTSTTTATSDRTEYRIYYRPRSERTELNRGLVRPGISDPNGDMLPTDQRRLRPTVNVGN